jgi:hypothetical protein
MRLPTPAWPVLVLALIQLVDAYWCWRPVAFIAECLEAVRFPRRYWRILTPLKVAAAGGLILGVWVPYLAALTTACLIAYFVIAIAMHIRARDFGRNLFMNATGMLVICVSVFVYCF